MTEHDDEDQQKEMGDADAEGNEVCKIWEYVLEEVEEEEPGLMQAQKYLHDELGLL